MVPDGQEMSPLGRLYSLFAHIQPAAQKGSFLCHSVVAEDKPLPEQSMQFFQKMPDQPFSKRTRHRAERGRLIFPTGEIIHGLQHF